MTARAGSTERRLRHTPPATAGGHGHAAPLDRTKPHVKGMIADPVNKAKSVVFTEEGLRRAEELFQAMFTKPD